MPLWLRRMLSRTNRLSHPKDILAVLRQGERYRDGGLLVRVRPTGRPDIRFAFIVPNTVSKKSTRRNRLRRQLRELIRAWLPRIGTGFDVTVTVRPGRQSCTTDELAESLAICLRRARLFRRPRGA